MEDVSIISEKLTQRVISCLSLIFIIFRSVCVCVYFSIVLITSGPTIADRRFHFIPDQLRQEEQVWL